MKLNNEQTVSGSGYHGGPPRGGPRGAPRGGSARRPNSREPLKFDKDFDFESSNAQFDKEEIERELKQKLTLSKIFLIFLLLYSYCSE